MFETVEIYNPVLDAVLAARLRAGPPSAQQMPSGLFSLRLAPPQFTDALGRNEHGDSISTVCLAAEVPLTRRAPADDNAEARHPLPKGEGCQLNLREGCHAEFRPTPDTCFFLMPDTFFLSAALKLKIF
jgi:hypothetical protein